MIIAFVRTVILYLFLIIGIRLMGKRQIGELSPSELVLAMLLSDLASVPMQDFGIPLLAGIIPIITILCVTMLISVLTMKSIKFRALVCGRPSIIIDSGRVVQREMIRNRLTVDELMEELRLQGATDIDTIKYAVLETNGQISFLPYAKDLPATAGDLHLNSEETALPILIINDGRLMEHNLRLQKLDRTWLYEQLAQHGARSVKDVYLMSVTENGGVYCQLREGAL